MRVTQVWSVCFSPTGTTRKIVAAIANQIHEASGLVKQEYDFTLPSKRGEELNFAAGDLVIFGTPVYAGRVPNVLLKYLEAIQGNGAIGVPVVVYGNRNYDDALIELRDILETCGFHTFAAGAFIGEHSFSRILAKDRPDEADIALAQQFALQIMRKLANTAERTSLLPVAVNGVLKPYSGYYQPRDSQGKAVDIRKVKPLTASGCIECGRCADVCPMGSIRPERVSEVSGVCIKCGACIKSCPVGAKFYDDEGYLYHQRELEEALTARAEPELFL